MTALDHALRKSEKILASKGASKHGSRSGVPIPCRLTRSGVEHVEILAPDHAPEWVHERAALWNRVEAADTRKNSQLAREVRVALPAELSHEARVELVRDFCQRSFVDRGMVADIALHAPGLRHEPTADCARYDSLRRTSG